MNHAQAAELIREALPEVGKRGRLLVQLIGHMESSYGRGWGDTPGAGSFNWGAIHGTYEGDYFTSIDSGPDGTYETKFRKYPDDTAAIQDLWSLLRRRYSDAVKLAQRGRWRKVSAALYRGGYYEGTSKDPQVNIQRHRTGLLKRLEQIQPLYETPSSLGAGALAVAVLLGLGLLGARAWSAR